MILCKCIRSLVAMVRVFPRELKAEVSKVLSEINECDRANDLDCLHMFSSMDQKEGVGSIVGTDDSLGAVAMAALQEVKRI